MRKRTDTKATIQNQSTSKTVIFAADEIVPLFSSPHLFHIKSAVYLTVSTKNSKESH